MSHMCFDATSRGNARRVVRGSTGGDCEARGLLLFGPAYGRACDHAYMLCQLASVIHHCQLSGNTPEECEHPPAPAVAFASDALTAPLIPSRPSTPLVRHPFQLYARPNLVPDEALVAFPQIRCSPDVSGARYAREHCGAICGEASGRLQTELPCKTDRPSVEDDRLVDTFLINTSSVQQRLMIFATSFYASSTIKHSSNVKN